MRLWPALHNARVPRLIAIATASPFIGAAERLVVPEEVSAWLIRRFGLEYFQLIGLAALE